MPKRNLGRYLSGTVLTGLLAFLAGCATSPSPPNAAWSKVHNPQDDTSPAAQGNAYRSSGNYGQYGGQSNAAMQPAGSQGNYPQANSIYPQPPTYAASAMANPAAPANNGWAAAGSAPYGASPTTTTRYFDPNVVPTGATGVAPAGSPSDVTSLPSAPPPGYAGPAPMEPMTISSVTTKKSDDDDGEWDWSHLAPDYTWKEFKKAVGWGPDQRLAKEAYDRAQALFNEKKYDEAAKEFYTASWRWPDSTMEEDAMFLEGESYFFLDQYGSAQDSYVNLLKKHDNTRYLDTVVARLFAIATYWEQLDLKTHHWPVTPNVTDKTQPWFDTFGNALACYGAVWLHDPTGPYADAALFRVANAHFRRGEWEDAAEHYDMLRKNHPKSKYQKDAHLLELQAKMRIYQGAKYSIVPLNDAQEIADQTLKQFAGQLGDEEPRVREARAVLFEQRAEREWYMAQYYDNKNEFRAAREYYKVLLEKYPRSTFAQKAQIRMQQIQNEPDEPPNHFKWLTAPFGDEK
jgi:outer membrane protein assembly factor BamD (BamD/ComL family)